MPADPWTDLAPLAGTAAEPLIHARKRFGLPAICGASGGMWTNRRYVVTCRACREEIARRLSLRNMPPTGADNPP